MIEVSSNSTKLQEIVLIGVGLTDLWASFEGHFKRAIHGETIQSNRLAFKKVGGTVQIVLPSSRALRYPNARLQAQARSIKYLDDCGEVAEFEPNGEGILYGAGAGIGLYGGKITENIVQAIARDLLVFWFSVKRTPTG